MSPAPRAATGWMRDSRRRPSRNSFLSRPECRDRRAARAGSCPAAAGPARIGLYLPGRGTGPARGHGHSRRRAPGSDLLPHRGPDARARRLPGAYPLEPLGPGFRVFPGPSAELPWLSQPPDWGRYSVGAQLADDGSFLALYQAALRLRREHPALGRGTLHWLDEPQAAEAAGAAGLLCFAREPGFVFAANLGPVPEPLPPHRAVLLASGPVADGSLPPDTAAWLSA
jgi:hypothetical protein